jgi:high frequency lysogenization protein
MVQGEPKKLQDPDTVNRIRASLFAGIRSAFLWHQCGGRRWQLLFNRNGYHAFARGLINA